MLGKAIVTIFIALLVYGVLYLGKKAEVAAKQLGWDKDLDEESRKRKERMERIRNSSKEKNDEESQNQ